MEDWELPLATGNITQQAKAQMNTEFSSNMPAYHDTHERYRYSEPRRMTDPVDPYPDQQCVPSKSEPSELVDPYSSENLYWEQPSCDNDLPDNPSWSTAPTPRPDTFITQTTPGTPTAEQKEDDRKIGAQAPETEKRNSKRRKSSTFIYYTDTEDQEQRRIRHIVKNLQIFENQQRTYGRQQLKAIKDGIA